MQRTTAVTGLTSAEVAQRRAAGQSNDTGERTSRTIAEIIRANVLTRFNAILGAMFVIIVLTGEVADALFGVVLVANALIGIVQEWLAKKKLDSLAVLSAPRAMVVRDGVVAEIMIETVVLDDLIELRTGDQICADGIVTATEGVEVDESLLTGESDPILKFPGDEVLSGAIVVAGSGRFQATRVGTDAYARKLAAEARRFTVVQSELQNGTNQILRWVTYALVPTVALLLWSQLRLPGKTHDKLPGVVAGVVAMVPEGLVLLTSFAFLLAARGLAKRNVLVQELPAVEGLARVDIVCVDKTGTVTEGIIEYREFELCSQARDVVDPTHVASALGALAADEHGNATMHAISQVLADPQWSRRVAVPFSSSRKWSAAAFEDRDTWFIGAPEMLWAARCEDDAVLVRANEIAASGQRVLLLARSVEIPSDQGLPGDLLAVAFVSFEERIRPDAPETFRYFAEQGVALRVISGDNPVTVAAVAQRAGIPNADRVFDARNLPDDQEALADILERNVVFGRVTPHQKRAMVQALQSRGHVVAMTGDGVNDALALKDADIGIAMGNGAAATRAVAQLVLLDSQFSRMPGVVAEGRRVIANVERVSNLYVTKTVYALLIALSSGLLRWKYPFLPRHFTVISTLTIGIPSFFLAVAPNTRRYVPGFVRRVLRFTVPAGTVAAAATLTCYGIVRHLANMTVERAAAISALVLMGCGLWVLLMLARPLTVHRGALVAVMATAFGVVCAMPSLRTFYALALPTTRSAWVVAASCGLAAVVALEILAGGAARPVDSDGNRVLRRTTSR